MGHNPSKSECRENRTVNLAILDHGLNDNTKIDSVPIVYQAVDLHKVDKKVLIFMNLWPNLWLNLWPK